MACEPFTCQARRCQRTVQPPWGKEGPARRCQSPPRDCSGTLCPYLRVLHRLLQLSNLGLHRVLAAQDVGKALCQLLLQGRRLATTGLVRPRPANSPHPICAASSARTPGSSLPPRGRPDPNPSVQPHSSPYPESLVGAEHRRDLVAGVSASHAAELAHQPLAGLAVVSHLLLVLWAHQTLHGHEEAQQSFRTPPKGLSPARLLWHPGNPK